MKKTCIVLLLILATACLYAQGDGITLRFSANHTCSFAELDSVVIENLTQGGSTVLHYPDTVITFIITDIHTPGGIHDALYLSQNYPNPFSGKTNIDMFVPGSDQFYINVYDLTGRIVVSYEKWLEQGMHHFAFYGCNKQTYVFTVSSQLYVQRRLMIQLDGGGGSSSRVIYKGQTQQTKSQPMASPSEFDFQMGDELRFTGYVTDGFGSVDHEVITDTPAADRDYLFDIVNSPPGQPSEISGDHSVAAHETGLVYEVDAVQGVIYQWSVPAGWTITAGQGSHAITVDAGDETGDITVVAENDCGIGPERTMAVSIHYTLTLVANPPRGGSVQGDGKYVEGTDVAVTATPEEGWEFVNWTSEDNTEVSDKADFTFSMPSGDIKLTANFFTEEDPDIIYGDGVTDIDGNDYITVIIGDQEWMAENLRVTRYRDGTAIPTGLDNTEWVNTTIGAYAVYDHNAGNTDGIDSPEEMVAIYGKLYNWFAVDNSSGLCPDGWSVPGNADWTQLAHYVASQGYPIEWDNPNGGGNALKSCRQVDSPMGGDCDTSEHPRWDAHDTHYGFNEFGFSSLPGGYRWGTSGNYSFIGKFSFWWSSSESMETDAYHRQTGFTNGSLFGAITIKNYGFAIRCLRDIAAPELYNLDLEVNPSGAGNVTGTGAYEESTQVPVTASASEGWEFIEWTGDTEHMNDPLDANATVTMPAQDITLTAHFAEIITDTYELTLVALPVGGGTVEGGGMFKEGAEVPVTATPKDGWEFVRWAGDTDHIDNTNSASTLVTMPAADVTLTAIFETEDDQARTVTDIDGNVYLTVFIGDQEWMAANLRVTRYANGDPIPSGLNNTEWRATTEGAFSVYPHDADEAEGIGSEDEMVAAYGKLYNALAVDDERGLCPTGWHVPSHEQWVRLKNYIIYEHGATNEWDDPNGVSAQLRSCRQINSVFGGDCETDDHPRWEADELIQGLDVFGFSALPGGSRTQLGNYHYLGREGRWRSTSNTIMWRTWHSNGSIHSVWYQPGTGGAVRCVKDSGEEPLRYTLSLNTDPDGAGIVQGAGEFVVYSETSISAIANVGWKFTGWAGDIQYVHDPDSPITIVIIPSRDITLTAVFEETAVPEIIYGDGVNDIDGNEYVSVIIGEQEWMAENLRTTSYSNGDPIPGGLSDTEWSDTQAGAYAVYSYDAEEASGIDSEKEMVEAYGKLYNFPAMDDARGLCPVGWSVPSRDDWNKLRDHLMDVYGWSNDWQDPNGLGNKLKSCRKVGSPLGGDCDTNEHPRWLDEEDDHYGTDAFGFSALPAGERIADGSFRGLGGYQMWAASTETYPVMLQVHAWGSELWKSSPIQNMKNGYSVRCIRDSND